MSESRNDPPHGSSPVVQGYVPPLTTGPGAYSAPGSAPAGYQVPPDLLADARVGRRLVIGVIGALFLIQVAVIVFYVTQLGLRKIDSQIIRLLIGAGLSVAVYQGKAWARRVWVVLLVLGGAAGVLSAIALFDEGLAALPLALMGLAYLACAGILQFSPRVRDFMMVQQVRDYPGRRGSL